MARLNRTGYIVFAEKAHSVRGGSARKSLGADAGSSKR